MGSLGKGVRLRGPKGPSELGNQPPIQARLSRVPTRASRLDGQSKGNPDETGAETEEKDELPELTQIGVTVYDESTSDAQQPRDGSKHERPPAAKDEADTDGKEKPQADSVGNRATDVVPRGRKEDEERNKHPAHSFPNRYGIFSRREGPISKVATIHSEHATVPESG